MSLRVIRTIATKELKESLRDRRTLFLMVFLPVLLYPALLLLVTQVASLQLAELEETESRIAIVGADADFEGSGEAEHPLVAALRDAENVRLAALDEDASFDPFAQNAHLVIDARSWGPPFAGEATAEVEMHFQSISEESRQALDRVESALTAWNDAELERRVQVRGLPETFVTPLEPKIVNHSTDGQQGGYLLGAVLPLLVIVTVLLGAYYPAIDLTAGEKERGSIQTLFTAPIRAVDIVAGKYLAVVGIAMISGLANLGSIVLVIGQGLSLAGDLGDAFAINLSAPVVFGLLWTIFLISLFLSALLLSVAVLARSFKEAQTYISPVYLVCLIPATLAQLPGVSFTPTLGVVPGVNAILLMKQLLLEGLVLDALFLTTVSSLAWTALTLVVAARLFGQEEVIFGERGSLALFPKRSELKPRPRPSMSEGIGWFAVAFVLLFYIGANIQVWNPQLGLAATLWLVLLAPTIAVAWYLRVDARETFHLRAPTLVSMVAATLLALGGLIVVNAANSWIDAHILQTPPELAEEMAKFFPRPESALDWIWIVFLVGVSPAICEEGLFRGFLFSSLRGRTQPWVVIGATALLFGLFHLSIYRLFGTTALGLVMGWLVWKSASVWPAVWFHFLNNTLTVVGAYTLGPEDAVEFEMPEWVVAVACVLFVAGALLLSRQRSPFAASERGGGTATATEA